MLDAELRQRLDLSSGVDLMNLLTTSHALDDIHHKGGDKRRH